MERPDYCPPAVYTLMLDSWQRAPSGRPLFSEITQRLRDILDHNFPAVSVFHIFIYLYDMKSVHVMISVNYSIKRRGSYSRAALIRIITAMYFATYCSLI